MPASRPSRTQSIALWRAHDEICVYCNKPIESLAVLEIDHIIPQKLLQTPNDLRILLERLGVPTLEINSHLNWLPVHGRPCNRRKGDQVLPDVTLLNYLGVARQQAARVSDEERKLRRHALSRNALAPLIHLIEVGHFSKQEAISYIEEAVPDSATRGKSDPLVLSFSVNVADAFNSAARPEGIPAPPELYDWLETQLDEALSSTKALFARAARIEGDCNGETVSVRYACWLLDLDVLPSPLPFSWELLEVSPFSEIYPDQDTDELFARGIHAKHERLIVDKVSSDPLPYQRCPNCMSSDLKRVSSARGGEEIYTIWCECGWAERF
jgi:hypothetical protein